MVYCFEGIDNGGDVLSLRFGENAKIEVMNHEKDLLNGVTRLKVVLSKEVSAEDDLYSYDKPKAETFEAVAVPYYTWGNRGLNQMRVWINRL